jgi:hypothetical protein
MMAMSELRRMIIMTQAEFKRSSKAVHTARWQGMPIADKPEMVSYELLNFHTTCELPTEELDFYRREVQPNLPWADDHHEERVGGRPLNPGVEWANWPWAKSADRFRTNQQFNHSYMERLWPKFAGLDSDGSLATLDYPSPHRGIRFEYGDLNSLVNLLSDEPDTRQAWIPLFFPEDTGVGDGGRKPCTLGYQFIVREGRLHIYYPLRSCDFVRHFRDDIYLAIRLGLWVIDECRIRNPGFWYNVQPGTYTMHCTSLHIFKNDWPSLFGEPR